MKTRLLTSFGFLLGVVACVSTNATVLDPTIKLASTCSDAVRGATLCATKKKD